MRFFDYTGFPPAFRKGCNAFLDAYNADSVVEDRLVRGGSVEAQCKRCVRARGVAAAAVASWCVWTIVTRSDAAVPAAVPAASRRLLLQPPPTACRSVCAEVCEGFSEEQRFSEYSVDASQSDAARGRRPPGAEGGDVKVVTKTRLRDKPFAEGPAADADGDALESAAGKKKQGGRPAAPGRKAEL